MTQALRAPVVLPEKVVLLVVVVRPEKVVLLVAAVRPEKVVLVAVVRPEKAVLGVVWRHAPPTTTCVRQGSIANTGKALWGVLMTVRLRRIRRIMMSLHAQPVSVVAAEYAMTSILVRPSAV